MTTSKDIEAFQKWFMEEYADPNVGMVETSVQRHAAWAAWQAKPAPQPVGLTWQQFVAACEAEYGEDFAPEEFADVGDDEKEELMRVVRMVERAHNIPQPDQQEKTR